MRLKTAYPQKAKHVTDQLKNSKQLKVNRRSDETTLHPHHYRNKLKPVVTLSFALGASGASYIC